MVANLLFEFLPGFCPEFNVGGRVVQNDKDAPYNYSCTRKNCLIYSTDMLKCKYNALLQLQMI